MTWVYPDHLKRQKLTPPQPGAALTGFPLVVPFSCDEEACEADGADLRVTDEYDTPLSFRIEQISTSGGITTAILRVVHSLLSSADSPIYVYYSNPAAESAASATLSVSGLAGAWDMQATSPPDWSGNGNHGTASGTLSLGPGVVAQAAINASTSKIVLTSVIARTLGQQWTLCWWCNPSSLTGARAPVGANTWTSFAWGAGDANTTYVSSENNYKAYSSQTTAVGEWHSFMFESPGNNHGIMYRDGTAPRDVSWSGTQNFRINWLMNGFSYPWKGAVDDVLFFDSVLSATQKAYYVAQLLGPGTWSAEESRPSAGPLIFPWQVRRRRRMAGAR